MTNEWNEFRAYTAAPTYFCADGNDLSFLGRFTMNMFLKNIGFARIFTVLARGYLFHEPDGSIRGGDPYSRTDYALRALCAWCSVPDDKKPANKAEWKAGSDFRTLHSEFPELVDENGGGWYYRHVHAVADFIGVNRKTVSRTVYKLADNIGDFDAMWRKKVVQYQVPLFAEGTKGDFLMHFDDAVADALELGALRCESVTLSPEQEAFVRSVTTDGVPEKITRTLAEYYLANKTDDSEWVLLPQTNFDAYFGSTAFTKMYLPKLPHTFMERRESNLGVSMYKVKFE